MSNSGNQSGHSNTGFSHASFVVEEKQRQRAGRLPNGYGAGQSQGTGGDQGGGNYRQGLTVDPTWSSASAASGTAQGPGAPTSSYPPWSPSSEVPGSAIESGPFSSFAHNHNTATGTNGGAGNGRGSTTYDQTNVNPSKGGN